MPIFGVDSELFQRCGSESYIAVCELRELRLNNIPPTLLPIHPATVLSGYFIFKPIPY